MAAVLKLRRVLTDVNFLDTSGLHLVEDGWTPRAARIVGGVAQDVEEVLVLEVVGDDHDDVAALEQPVADMARYVDEYARDTTVEDAVWFYSQLSEETSGRRAFVKEIQYEWKSPHYSGDMVSSQPLLQVTILRDGAWESDLELTQAGASPAAAAAVVYDHTVTADIAGNLAARMALLRLESGVDSLDRFWIGLRSANKRDAVGISSFEEVWECEDGTLGTDASLAADATASPGGGGNTKVRVTPGTETWEKRLSIQVSDVSVADPSAQYGRFLWLLRALVIGSPTTWEVQLRWGYDHWDDDDFVEGAVFEISNTNWDYYEMGVKPIPLRDLQAVPTTALGSVFEGDYEVQIWARRTSGTDSLDLDCLCPVPVDEGFMKIWNADLATGILLNIGCSPGGTFFAMGDESRNPPISAHDFYLPVGDGRTIIVYARSDRSVLADTVDVDGIWYRPRWLGLRGAD